MIANVHQNQLYTANNPNCFSSIKKLHLYCSEPSRNMRPIDGAAIDRMSKLAIVYLDSKIADLAEHAVIMEALFTKASVKFIHVGSSMYQANDDYLDQFITGKVIVHINPTDLIPSTLTLSCVGGIYEEKCVNGNQCRSEAVCLCKSRLNLMPTMPNLKHLRVNLLWYFRHSQVPNLEHLTYARCNKAVVEHIKLKKLFSVTQELPSNANDMLQKDINHYLNTKINNTATMTLSTVHSNLKDVKGNITGITTKTQRLQAQINDMDVELAWQIKTVTSLVWVNLMLMIVIGLVMFGY